MDSKLVVVVLLTCLVGTECMLGVIGAISGQFKFHNFMCDYWEKRKPGPGPRLLNINCPHHEINCVYRGNPHSCRWYHNNQPAYYRCLVDKLATDDKSPCNPNSVVCDQHCSEITFTREQEESSGKQGSLVFERLRVFEGVKDDEGNAYN